MSKKTRNGVDWGYFDRFETISDKYLPSRGEGDNEATQVVTAVSKLIYKWYNDGDVYDNTYNLDGWFNDLSSYANWLHKHVGGETGADTILEGISECYNDAEYECLLKELADTLLDEEWLAVKAGIPKSGSIYDCDGVFKFREEDDEDDDW